MRSTTRRARSDCAPSRLRYASPRPTWWRRSAWPAGCTAWRGKRCSAGCASWSRPPTRFRSDSAGSPLARTPCTGGPEGPGSEPEPLPDGRGQARLVHRVEMQSGRPAGKEAVAKLGDYIQPEASNRGGVVPQILHLEAQPARDLGPASVREAGKLREIPDRHDSGHDRRGDAERPALVDETKIGIGVEEVLRDRRVRARLDLRLEVRHILPGAARLRVEFGVAGDFDVEVIAGPFADESHQLAGVAKLSGARGARRQVPAQGDDVIDAFRLVQLERRGDVGARRADAGDMGRRAIAGGLDFQDGLQRAVARGAARAVSAGEKPRFQLRELLPACAQLLHAFRGLRREELETEGARVLFLRFHVTARRRDWARASARPGPGRAPCAGHSQPPGPRRSCRPRNTASPDGKDKTRSRWRREASHTIPSA